MRSTAELAHLAPRERRTAIARILADGILRQLRAAPPLIPTSENRDDDAENRLEPVAVNPLTVHVG